MNLHTNVITKNLDVNAHEEFLGEGNPQAQQTNKLEILKGEHFKVNGKLITDSKHYNPSIKKLSPSRQGEDSNLREILKSEHLEEIPNTIPSIGIPLKLRNARKNYSRKRFGTMKS